MERFMVAPLNVKGERYGRLVALERVAGPKTVWAFVCDCGARISARLDHVRSGRQVSCGCLRSERIAAASLTHGQTVNGETTAEYRAWSHAKARCNNPKDGKYADYGGRGIKMCAAWERSFSSFLKDMGPRPAGTTLDRVNVDGDYGPDNCRWATATEQVTNRRLSLYVDHQGQRLPLTEYARIRGVPYKALHARIRRGENPAEAASAVAANLR